MNKMIRWQTKRPLGILIENGQGVYIFNEDTAFDSPSYAAASIVGGNANGQKLWKYNGKSLKDVERDDID